MGAAEPFHPTNRGHGEQGFARGGHGHRHGGCRRFRRRSSPSYRTILCLYVDRTVGRSDNPCT